MRDETAEENASQMMGEVFRVLKPGGCYIIFSLFEPKKRLHFLRGDFGWTIKEIDLPVTPFELPEQGSTYVYVVEK